MCVSCDTCTGWRCRCDGVEHCSWFESDEPCQDCGGTYDEYRAEQRRLRHERLLKDHEQEPWYASLAGGLDRVNVIPIFGPYDKPWTFELWLDGKKVGEKYQDSTTAYRAAGELLAAETKGE
jgi:hypothetical protein